MPTPTLQSADRFPNSNYWTETHSNGKGIYISCFQLDPFIYDRSLLGVGFLQPLEMPIDWRSASPPLPVVRVVSCTVQKKEKGPRN